MMYINYYDTNLVNKNYSFTQLLNDEPLILTPNENIIKTLRTKQPNIQKLKRNGRIDLAYQKLHLILDNSPVDITNIQNYYQTFKIPKHSGGLRTINAPKDALKFALEQCYDVFKNIINALPHNTAYAYTKGRDSYEAVKQHRTSNWFLKLDIKDFFPSCNKQLLITQLQQVFPFSVMLEEEPGLMSKLLDFCLLNNELPQGTNMSPLLTNTLMVPFDWAFTQYCEKYGFVYTRYADDMLISHKDQFSYKTIQTVIEKLFESLQYPFKLKKEKTRYGSVCGSNWNLGLMLNKDHNITIGHKKKKIFKAMLNNFATDLTKEIFWDKIDLHELLGLYSYYHRIEPEYIGYVVNQYSQKFNFDIIEAIKDQIKN